MHRRFYYVVPDHDKGSLYLGGSLIGRHASADDALAAALRLARSGGGGRDDEAEVLVQQDDGRYRLEWTSVPDDGPYGAPNPAVLRGASAGSRSSDSR